jgi:hypothetical protein
MRKWNASAAETIGKSQAVLQRLDERLRETNRLIAKSRQLLAAGRTDRADGVSVAILWRGAERRDDQSRG